MKSPVFYKFNVNPDNASRIDKIIANELPEYSRSRIQTWIKNGNILLNGKTCLPKDIVKESTLIELTIEESESLDIEAQNLPLEIIYEDEDIIIVNKDSGMVTHTAVGNFNNTLQNGLLHRFPELKYVPRAGIIHRLDKQTSGILIIARNLKSQHYLSTLMQSRLINKKYSSIVSGIVSRDIVIDKPIGRHHVNRKKMTVREDGKQARSIVTVVKVLENSSLLDIEIVTGRTHQIRVHLSSLGNPVFGDHLYGFKNNRFVKNPKIMDFLKNYEGFALHARYIRFIHPITNKDFEIECLPGHSFNVIKSLLLENKNGCTN